MKNTSITFKYVLTDDKLKKYMNKKYFKQYILAKQSNRNITMQLAHCIASAVKKWAIKQGATHFTHWFCPLNNAVAEKYVSFTESDANGNYISTLSGKALLQSQADASSFVSAKQCSTHKACGYVCWDFYSRPFIMQTGTTKTLYIPSMFYNYFGQALDYKIPLLKATQQLSKSATEFMHLLGYTTVKGVNSNLGCEQEYFLLDKCKVDLRTDIKLTGQTLFGAPLSINAEVKNNYYRPFNQKLNNFTSELSSALWRVGILAKLQHGEVSPKQLEVVPVFSPTNIATDQNTLLIKVLTQVAEQHGLKAILAEKPFAHLNGSGKHNNWSLATDSGINLLDYTKVPPIVFLTMFTSVLSAVDKYNALLMASVTTLENSFRLGGHEAPTCAFSVYIGSSMQKALKNYVKTGQFNIQLKQTKKSDFFATSIQKDICNRNRTSTFAFTGNKFEFRAVGSNQNVALANIILNTIVVAELKAINAKIKKEGLKSLEQIIKNNIKEHLRIVYNGNCYGKMWTNLAKKRNIPNHKNNPNIYKLFCQPEILQLFLSNNVYSKAELVILQNSLYKNYLNSAINIAKTFCKIITTQIKPALENWLKYKTEQNKSNTNKKLSVSQHSWLANTIEQLTMSTEKVSSLLQKILVTKPIQKQCDMCYRTLLPLIQDTRKIYDNLEPHIPQSFLPFPTYDSLLID